MPSTHFSCLLFFSARNDPEPRAVLAVQSARPERGESTPHRSSTRPFTTFIQVAGCKTQVGPATEVGHSRDLWTEASLLREERGGLGDSHPGPGARAPQQSLCGGERTEAGSEEFWFWLAFPLISQDWLGQLHIVTHFDWQYRQLDSGQMFYIVYPFTPKFKKYIPPISWKRMYKWGSGNW